MREIDLIHRQIELVAVSIAGRVRRLQDALEGLSFYTKNLFRLVPVSSETIERWVVERRLEELDTGFFESSEYVERARAEGPLRGEGVFSWRATMRDDVELRRRFHLLETMRPHMASVLERTRGVAWLYFQDANTPHGAFIMPAIAPDTLVPSDFNWHEYHSFTIVRPADNPERATRWSPPNVDYGGVGLISCVSIPVYDGDELLGVWTMDVRLSELHADIALQPVGSVGRRQTNFLTDYAGRLIAHPAMDPAAQEEKGSVHNVMLSTLGGEFVALDVPALAAKGHGELELTDRNGERLFVAYRVVPEIQWIVFATFPTADMVEATQAAFKRAFDKLASGDLSAKVDAVGDETMQQLVASYNDMTHTLQESLRRREEAEAEKRKLALEQERLSRELEIAASIQLSMLPRAPSHPGFEFAGSMKPADEVGGDFYDVLSRGDKLWITVGDVSSHGLGAGLVMMIAQAIFQAVFETEPDMAADEVLRHVNRLLHANLSKGLGRGHYVTGQVLLHRGDGHFDCVGAHLWPMILSPGSREVRRVEIMGPWLGIVPELPRVPVSRVALAKGEVMCLYSDGITEARNAEGEMFGLERLSSEVTELVSSGRALADCATELLAKVAAFAPEQDDDRTVLFIRRVEA